MNITEFINTFAENHQIQHTDGITGTIVAKITTDTYLVNMKDVKN